MKSTILAGAIAASSRPPRRPQHGQRPIRSNAVSVCVTDGADGFCYTMKPGAPGALSPTTPSPSGPGPGDGQTGAAPLDRQAASGRIGSIRDGRRFGRGRGPRTLAGTVDPEASGLKDVRVRLARSCSFYDAAREPFVAARRCGVAGARTFSVGAGATFSYLVTDSRVRRARGRTGARGTVRLRGLRGAWRITARRGGFVPALPGGAP